MKLNKLTRAGVLPSWRKLNRLPVKQMTAATAVNARVHARTTVCVITDMGLGFDSSWAQAE